MDSISFHPGSRPYALLALPDDTLTLIGSFLTLREFGAVWRRLAKDTKRILYENQVF